MSLFSTLKRNARAALSGNWGKAILTQVIGVGVVLLLSILQGICVFLISFQRGRQAPAAELFPANPEELFWWYSNHVPSREMLVIAAFSVLTLLLLAPIMLGTVKWFFLRSGGGNPGVGEVFSFFESLRQYGRSLWYYIQMAVRTYLWSILFYLLPLTLGGALIGFLKYTLGGRISTYAATMVMLLVIILSILLTVLYAVFINRYALVPYLLCGEGAEKLTVRDAFKVSVHYTKGYRGSLLLFSLSFFGWFLLAPFTLYLILLYVGPYYQQSLALYARYIIEKSRYQPPNATREFVVGEE